MKNKWTPSKIARHLDSLEKLLNETLRFQNINKVHTNIAVGSDPTAGCKNTTNVVVLENARRSIAVMREMWQVEGERTKRK